MIKRKGLKQFKRLKATMMSSDTQEKRTKRARALEDRIRRGCSVEKCVWLHEKDFTLDISLNSQNSHIYGFENKDNIQDNHLFKIITFSIKAMLVSVERCCEAVFCEKWRFERQSQNLYIKNLEKELLPKVNRIMNNNTWIFIQDLGLKR